MHLAYVLGFLGLGTPSYFGPIFQKNPTIMKKNAREQGDPAFGNEIAFTFNYYYKVVLRQCFRKNYVPQNLHKLYKAFISHTMGSLSLILILQPFT